MKKNLIVLIILSIFLLVSGISYKKFVLDHDFSKAKIIYEEKNQLETHEYEMVTIFVPNKEFKKLEQKAVKIKKTENRNEKIRFVFEEIKKNSKYKIEYQDENGEKIEKDYFDYSIRIMNAYFDNKDMYLNFNYKFQSTIINKEQELMLIYSIVNTYTAFDDIDRVKILVNNEEVGNLKYYNISGFLEKDLNI